MKKKRFLKYDFRYEVASERKKISGYTLIPKSNRTAEVQHMTEHEAFQAMQRCAFKGESEEVKKLLLIFPKFKREDIKVMLMQSVANHGKTLIL